MFLYFTRNQLCVITGLKQCDTLQIGEDYTTCIPINWMQLQKVKRGEINIYEILNIDESIQANSAKWLENYNVKLWG